MALDPVHRTAFTAAWYRTAHLRFDGEPKIFEDPLALDLTGASDEEFGRWWDDNRDGPVGSSPWVLRARYTEDRLGAARHRGIGQYVMLGAGLDSFVHRHAATLRDLRVFEVDDPPLQRWKRERLAELGLAEPGGCVYVACDFETTRLIDALRAGGFEAAAPAFISWLAVTQYVTVPAIEDTLRWGAGLPAGSELVLTYVVPGPIAEQAKQMWAEQGVSFATFFHPDEIDALLRRAGFELVEHLEPDDADRAYFSGRHDGLHAPRVERLVSATVA